MEGKKSVDLSADVRRHETGLSSACQHKINQNLKYPVGQGGVFTKGVNACFYTLNKKRQGIYNK